MIQYNEVPENKISKIIKHRCKIKSTYYYIQIYKNASIHTKKITFLIKSSPNNTRYILYKREFYYNELLDYNKYFKYFSSFESIFTSIEQSIFEQKFNITENNKYLLLTIRINVEKLQKYANININLNTHTNISPIVLPKNKKKKFQKIKLGIQNKEELNYAIYDIRKRLKNIERSQSQIMMSNYNINNTNINNISNSNINELNNNKYIPIINSKGNYNNNENNDKNNIPFINSNNKNNINDNSNIKFTNGIIINENNMNQGNNNSNISNVITNNNINNEKKNSIDNNNTINDNNNNFINISNINNTKENQIDSSEINLNKLNESNLDSKKMLGINKMLLKKLESLEKSINNKDIKIKYLENKVNNIETSNKNSRSKIYLRNKNKSIDNNKLSSFQQNQTLRDLEYSNAISTIKKKNSQSISQEQEQNYFQNNQRKKNIYNKTQDNSDINDIIGYEYSDIDKNRNIKANNSIDIVNQKEYSDLQNEDNNYNNNNNIYQNNLRIIKEYKNNNSPIIKTKSSKKAHSAEKYKNNLPFINKKESKKYHDRHYKNKDDKKRLSIVKVKGIKKQNSVENSRYNQNDRNINAYNMDSIDKSKINKESDDYKESNKKNVYNENISEQYINNKNKINSSSDIEKKNLQFKNPRISPNNKMNKILICEKEDIKKYVNSNIFFRKDELRLLKDKISNKDRKLHVFFDLIYRASQDGEEEIIIKDSIEGYCETLTLFYTYEGARFGVYLKKEEVHAFIKGHFYREVPGSCFFVGLNNLIIFQINKRKTCKANCNDVLCYGRTYYFNKNGSNWIIFTPPNQFLKKKCIIGNGEELFRNLDIEKMVGDIEYHIKDVEIFNVAIERFHHEK